MYFSMLFVGWDTHHTMEMKKDFNNVVFDDHTLILCDQVRYMFPISAMARYFCLYIVIIKILGHQDAVVDQLPGKKMLEFLSLAMDRMHDDELLKLSGNGFAAAIIPSKDT